jgi:hypothetical protein
MGHGLLARDLLRASAAIIELLVSWYDLDRRLSFIGKYSTQFTVGQTVYSCRVHFRLLADVLVCELTNLDF